MRIAAIGLSLALAGCATGASAQRGDEGAEAFVRAVYAAYGGDADAAAPPDLGDPSVWSPRMSALIRRDRELAPDGDLPFLDADPLCECQDWEDLRVLAITIRHASTGWVARVVFENGGEMLMTMLQLTGDPIRGWRIDDVLNPPYPSLATELEATIRRVEAGGSAHD